MKRPRDRVRIETDAGGFEDFEKVELVQDLLDISAMQIVVGDERSWASIERLIEPGRPFRLYLNDRLQMTGRAEANDVPADAMGGSQPTVVVRTKLSDASYASADPSIRVTGGSIKDFILKLYADLGYGPGDFVFAPETDRNIITGKKVGASNPVDLAPFKVEQAKVNPPETVRDAAARHLLRHHMIHWDASDGRINVGRPAISDPSLYRFWCLRGRDAAKNNVLSIRRGRDWSELPSEVWVYGTTAGADVAKAAIRGVAVDLDAAAVAADEGHFKRRIIIPGDGVKTRERADAQAQRELATRSRRKDTWEITVDGWSFWDGQRQTSYTINACADVETWHGGGTANGKYIVTRCTRSADAQDELQTVLSLAHPSTMVF